MKTKCEYLVFQGVYAKRHVSFRHFQLSHRAHRCDVKHVIIPLPSPIREELFKMSTKQNGEVACVKFGFEK